jgi:hypothetical protein
MLVVLLAARLFTTAMASQWQRPPESPPYCDLKTQRL